MTTTGNIFLDAAKACPPSATGSRAILEVMAHFAPDEPISERCLDRNDEPIPNAPYYSALFAVRAILGPLHPAVRDLERAMREVLQ